MAPDDVGTDREDVSAVSALLLSTRLIAVSDRPPQLFKYGLAEYDAMVRAFEPYIATMMPDTCAWETLFTDEQRLYVARVAYGKRLLSSRTCPCCQQRRAGAQQRML